MRFGLERHGRKGIAWIVALVMLFIVMGMVHPGRAEAADVQPATELGIKVKDGSGNVTINKTYTVAEMEKMQLIQRRYSSIDSMPAPCFTAAQGVDLQGLLQGLDIDINKIEKIRFLATDDFAVTINKADLFDTPRYYYPNIAKYWDSDNERFTDQNAAAQGASLVEPIIAIESYQARAQNATSAPNFGLMDRQNMFRLCLGQKTVGEVSNNKFLRGMNRIEIQMAAAGQNDPVTAPKLVSSEVTSKGDVSLTFDRTMADPANINAGGQFDVQVDGKNVAVIGVVKTNTPAKIKLELATKITGGQSVTVAYTKSADPGKQIKAADNGVLESLRAQTVANNLEVPVTPGTPVFTIRGNGVTPQVYTMNELKAMEANTGTYSSKSGDVSCTGVALSDLLASLNVPDYYKLQINTTDAATYPVAPVKVSDVLNPDGKYLLTYAIDGQPIITDATSLRIYWSGKVIKNVTGITITKTVAKTSTLTISGDALTEPVTFTFEQLQPMPQVETIFTTISNAQERKSIATKGIKLTDLLDQAGINIDKVEKIRFIATDAFEKTLSKKDLLDTPRYCFPKIKEELEEGKVLVEPVLALLIGDSNDYSNMYDFNTLTLFLGQTYVTECHNNLFVKGVCQIEVYAVPENPYPPTVKPERANNILGQSINLSFNDDANWRQAITDITVDGVSIAGKYEVTVGQIAIATDVFAAVKDYQVVIKASGYEDARIEQSILKELPVIFTVGKDHTVLKSYTMAELLQFNPTTYDYYETLSCTGVALADILTSLGLNASDPKMHLQIDVKDAATFHINPVALTEVLDANEKYLLAYEINGQPIAKGNDDDTVLRFYYSNGTVYRHATGISLINVNNYQTTVTMPVDKCYTWKIKFSDEVLSTQELSQHIYVTENTGGSSTKDRIPVTPTISQTDKKLIEVAYPTGGYLPGKYTLWIKNSLKSIQGTPLKELVKMNFTVN